MHHTRLVGGLISLAALLTLLLVPAALVAASRPTPAPSGGPSPSPSAGAIVGNVLVAPLPRQGPRPTRAQRRARRLSRQRHNVLRVARSQRGMPYVYGGASRGGFDSFGFTMYVYERVGIHLSHCATDQARRGERLSLRHLKPGDLAFYGGPGYYSHVAIYAGHGRILESSHTGTVVSCAPLRSAATARRPIGS